MKKPLWVSRKTVEVLHHDSLESYGGGLPGTRDGNALESALGRPQNKFAYGKVDVFVLASAYAFGIVMNHPFSDGNKRTALATMGTFIESNAKTLIVPPDDLFHVMVTLANKKISESQLAEWLRGAY